MSILFEKLKILSRSPGVYIFRNNKSEVLYVGKAASLKDRVRSYFVGAIHELPKSRAVHEPPLRANRPIELFINEVYDLEIRKTDTVLEAYILEQDLIKKFQPKYNMMSKDDKSFSYVIVTKEEWPRFVVLRKTELDGRERIHAFRNKKERKFVFPTKNKIHGPYTSRRQIEDVLKILRKIFPYHARPEQSEKRCFDYHIGLCPGPYDNAISKKDYRKNIRAIRMILEGKKKNLINKMRKEMNECSEKQDYECAGVLRNQMFALKHIQDVALITNRDENFKFQISDFKSNPNDKISNLKKFRIEGYDISNISGKYSAGSMVVFDNMSDVGARFIAPPKPDKNQYRKFKIKTIKGANDVGAMEEVLMRRFRNNWRLPNLIILDGGRGHLNMARKVLRIYHLEIPLLAVAKGPTRKKMDLYTYGSVPKMDENIIEQIRDEAHRFAISYHRGLRNRELIEGKK